jgi:DNA-binding XRE family transcriptional regulator
MVITVTDVLQRIATARIRCLMTPAQCRAARAILELKRVDLAKMAGVAEKTLGDFERGRRVMLRAHVEAVRRQLERLGIEFTVEGQREGATWPKERREPD